MTPFLMGKSDSWGRLFWGCFFWGWVRWKTGPLFLSICLGFKNSDAIRSLVFGNSLKQTKGPVNFRFVSSLIMCIFEGYDDGRTGVQKGSQVWFCFSLWKHSL